METPSWQEAFKGKDVVQGGELVEALVVEEVGLPVFSRKFQEKKVRVMVDRAPGEEDFEVRQKEEFPQKLMGVLISTGGKCEYVYLGIHESGLVIKVEDEYGKGRDHFNKDFNQPLYLNWDRFVDYFTSANALGKNKIILKEDEDPDRFFEIVVSSVEIQRQKLQEARNKRTEIRQKLISKLFGQETNSGSV